MNRSNAKSDLLCAKKAALFDLDGTLLNTEGQYATIWGNVFKRYHPHPCGQEHLIKGQTLEQILAQYFPKEVHPQIISYLKEQEHQMTFRTFDGVDSFLNALRQHSIKTAIVTSSPHAKVDEVFLQIPHFESLFDVVIASEDIKESKPSPECFLTAAARLNALPQDCVGFEDSLNGLRAVRAAGMLTIGLPTTFPLEQITPLCDIVINDFNDKLLQRLWS